MEPTVAAVHEAIAASRPDDECLVVPRPAPHLGADHRAHPAAGQLPARRRARLPHRAGRSWPTTRAGRTTSASTCTTATSTSRRCSGRSRPGSPRSTSTTATSPTSCATCSTTHRPTAIVVHSRFAPTLAEVLPTLPPAARHPPGARRLRPRAAPRRRRGTRTRWPPRRPSAPAVDLEPGRPLHPLHRRDHRACPRACCGATATPTSSASAARVPTRSTASSPRPPAALRALVAPPFMHGAGHWVSFRTWNTGGTVLDPGPPRPARRRRRLGAGRA